MFTGNCFTSSRSWCIPRNLLCKFNRKRTVYEDGPAHVMLRVSEQRFRSSVWASVSLCLTPLDSQLMQKCKRSRAGVELGRTLDFSVVAPILN